MAKRNAKDEASSGESDIRSGNFISEWFGYRVYPVVSAADSMIEVQSRRECPFLSAAIGESRECIKGEASKGVCTISTVGGRGRDEWVVCPYRGVEADLLEPATRRLFSISEEFGLVILSAPSLAKDEVQAEARAALSQRKRVFVFFQDKLGGEISLPKTERSPELSFDITLVEIIAGKDLLTIGKYGILEVQTMDFHGSYRHAVQNLTDALRLHKKEFPAALKEHQEWLSEGVEGPNIANVFKRTFYQMVFKFQLGLDKSCAGCVLAISESVWLSWQRHLGNPELAANRDGTFALKKPTGTDAALASDEVPKSTNLKKNQPPGELSAPAWIYVFEIDPRSDVSPNKIKIRRMILTDAHSFSYYALDVAPAAAVASATDIIRASLIRRLAKLWSDFAAV